MIGLIQAEIYKIYKNKSVWACLSLALAIGVVLAVGINYGFKQQVQSPISKLELTGLTYVGQSFAIGSLLAYLTVIAVTAYVTCDFGFSTIKYPIAKGYSRSDIYLSKLVGGSLIALLVVLGYSLSTTLTMTLLNGFGEVTAELLAGTLQVIAVQGVLHMAVATIVVMFSFCIKKGSAALAFNLMTFMFLAGYVIKFLNFLGRPDLDTSSFWVISHMAVLSDVSASPQLVLKGIMVALVTTMVSTLVGVFSFSRCELK